MDTHFTQTVDRAQRDVLADSRLQEGEVGRGSCLNRRCMQVVAVLEAAAQAAAEAPRYTYRALCITLHYAVQQHSDPAVALSSWRSS